jgi:uncharacterized protein (TIGR03083 family)
MDPESTWRVITEQRLALAELLHGLSAAQWEQASLCAGWRIRDVAAHVAMASQELRLSTMITEAIRARGSFDRLNHDLAVRHAARPTEDLVAELRHFAGSRRLPAPTNARNILFDVLVHAQDVAIPVRQDHPMPLAAARASAERVWTMGWPFWARRRLRGVRLVAGDTDWVAGDGPELHGPIAQLLLLLTGRPPAVLPQLSGPGLERLEQARAVRRSPTGAS